MPIEFVPAICPKCGGELRVPNNVDVIKCMYCGADIVLHDSSKIRVQPALDVEKCIELAERARDTNNSEEVYKYATLALEQQPNNQKALLLKGLGAAMLQKFNEALIYLELGVGNVKPDTSEHKIGPVSQKNKLRNSSEIKETAVKYNIGIATLLYNMHEKCYEEMTNLWDKYGIMNIPGEVYDANNDKKRFYIKWAFPFICNAYKLVDGDEDLLDLINDESFLPFLSKHVILILRKNLVVKLKEFKEECKSLGSFIYEGFRIEKKLEFFQLKEYLEGTTLFNSSELEELYAYYDNELLEIEDNAINKSIRKTGHTYKSEKKCFIATATMGDIDHPHIVTLREYRDNVLLNSEHGKLMINAYYFLSPPIAKLISNNRTLRSLSEKFVVYPAYKKAIKVLKSIDK